jgi:hypothetical protein
MSSHIQIVLLHHFAPEHAEHAEHAESKKNELNLFEAPPT